MPSWQDDPSLSQTWDAGASTLASSPPPPSAPVDDTPSRPAWLDDPSLGRTWNDVDEKEGSGYIYQGGQKTWADTGHALAAGAYAGVKAPGSGLMEELATTPQGKRYWADTASEARKQAEEQEEQMTPAGKLGIHDWRSPTFWEEQAAPIGAMAIPALVTGGVGAPAAVTAAVGGVTGAAMASGQYTSDVSGGIEKAPIEQLKQDPAFKADIDNGVDEATARYNLAQRALDPRKQALVAGLGFGAGAFGPYAELAGVGNPVMKLLGPSEHGLITTALAGGVEGVGAQGTQLLGQNYTTQQTLHQAHAGEAPTFGSVTEGTAPFLGLAFGVGLLGAGLNYHPGIDEEPREGSKVAPAREAEPGKATSVGSSREGLKPIIKEKTADVVDAAGNQAAAPPPAQEQGGEPEVVITPDIAVATAALNPELHPSEGTPESKISQSGKVQPEDVRAQPGVETPQDQQGSPLTGKEGAGPPPPQRVAEGQPAPRPDELAAAPARPVADVAAPPPRPAPPAGAEPTIREPDQALIAQQGEVKAGARDAVYYPPGTPPPPPIAGVHRAIVQDGEVVRSLKKLVSDETTNGQVFDYNPKKINLSQIQNALDNNKLNELLKLGGTPKSEAIARAQAGEAPAAVVTRDQEGNELKASIGTESTLPEQIAAHEATKASPEHVVQVENHQDTLADRFAKTRAENIAKAQAEAAQRVTPTGRTLEDQAAAAHEISIDQQLKQRAQEKLQAEREAKKAQKAGKNWTKEEIASINHTNTSANNITAAHRLKSFNDHVAVFNSAKAMVDAARKAKVEIPKEFHEGHPYNPNVVRLREAADLVASASKGREATNEALGRFIVRDHMINEGRVEEALEDRRQEGALGTASPEGVAEVGDKQAVQKMLAEYGVEREGEHPEGSITPESRAEEGEEEQPKEEARERPKVLEEAVEGKHYDAFAPRTSGFQVEKKGMSVGDRLKANKLAKEAALKREKGLEITAPKEKEPGVQRQEVREGGGEDQLAKIKADIAARKAEMDRAEAPAVRGPKTITTSHDNGTDIEINTADETSAKKLLAKVDYTKFPPALRSMAKALVERMTKVAGDVPVYAVEDAEMRKTQNKGTSYGAYSEDHDHILINKDVTHPDGMQTTIIHEIYHSATVKLFKYDPEFQAQIKALFEEAKPQWEDKVVSQWDEVHGMTQAQQNATSSPIEFLTELMSNPSIQKEFMEFKISKQLAQQLNIPTWRKASLWSGLLSAIRDAFHLPPRYVSVIEAAMNLSERGMHGRIEGRDEALEYAGRLHEAHAGTMGALDRLAGVNVKRESFDDIFKQMGHVDFQRLVQDPEEEGKVREKLLNTTGSRAMNLLNSAGEHVSASLADELWTKGLGLVPTDTIRVNNEAKFGPKGAGNPLYRAQEGYEKLTAKMQKLIKVGDPIFKELQILVRRNPEEFNRLDDLLHDASAWNFHPGEELGQGKNAHLTSRPDPANTDMSDWGAHAHYNEGVERWEKLGAGAQNLFNRITDYTADMNKKEINATRNSLVRGILDHYGKDEDFQDILARAKKSYYTKKPMGSLNDAEREQLGRYAALDKAIRKVSLDNVDETWGGKTEQEKFGSDKNIKAVQNYDMMAKKPGPYVPASRFGEHIIRAKHLVPTDPDGVVDPDHSNEVVFDDRKAAFRYMSAQPRASAETTHYFTDNKGNREYVDDASPRQQGAINITPKKAYRVRVQNSHVEMAESLQDANRKRAALLQDGSIDPDSVSQVELTRNNRNIDYGLDQPAVRAMQDSIDGLTHLDAPERQALKDNIQQVALAHMNGNRLSRNLMRKNNVRGASDDLIRSLDQRRIASAGHIARSEVMLEVNKAMDDMWDNLDSANTPDNFKKSAIIREMENRIYGLGSDGYTGKQTSPTLARMNSIAFLQYLVSPAHVMLHLTHPILTSIPTMASKQGRGMFQVYREMSKTYLDMGGFTQVGKGAKHMWGAWSDNWTPTDFITNIKDTLRSKGASEELLSAIDRAGEMNLLHNTGYDFSRAYQGLSKVDKGLAMARDWASELTGSADAINRIGTFATEYKIARSEGLDHEAAIRSAADMLSQTQGRFSYTNRARYLQNPTVRAFMQFKNFPMLIYNILAKHTYNLFRPEEPGARWQAAKALMGMIGTGMALTGVGGGLPEPIRLGVTLTNALGLTDSWQEEEDKMRRWVASNWSPQLATFVMDGLGGAAGIDIHHRGGFSSLMFQFDPKSTSASDYMNWIQQWVGGTPLGLVNNAVTGLTDFRDGDVEGGVENLFPSKEVVDLMKAWRLGTEGKRTAGGRQVMPPIGWGGMASYAAGFTPESVAHAQTAQAVLNARAKEAQTAHQRITKQYQEGDKGGAIKALQMWNVSHPEHAMKTSDLTKPAKPSILGQPMSPASQRSLKETQRAYGLAP